MVTRKGLSQLFSIDIQLSSDVLQLPSHIEWLVSKEKNANSLWKQYTDNAGDRSEELEYLRIGERYTYS